MKILFILFFMILIYKSEAQTSDLYVADSLYSYGKYTQAINYYKKLENSTKKNESIAKSYLALGNLEQAIINYQKTLEESPNDMLIKFQLAKLLAKNKKNNASQKLLFQLIKFDSLNPNYHYYSAKNFQSLDSTKKAQQFFLKTFKLDTTHQNAIYELAKFNLTKRKYDIANYYVEKGLEASPNNAKLISIKAQNYYWKEDYHKAKDAFIKLIDLKESSLFVYEKLSYCYARTYDYENAIVILNKAIQINPKDYNNIYRLGLYYEKLGDYEKAKKNIQKSLKMQDVPLDAEYRKLGTIFNKQKKYDEAIKAFNLAIKENPEDELSYFYKLSSKLKYYKDTNAKISEIEKFQKQFPNSPFSKILDKNLSELKTEQFQSVTD